MGSVIVGSGVAVPPLVVTNHDLARVMDTTDEWIRSRSGVAQRHFAAPGVGSSALGAAAVTAALADAGVDPAEVDLLVAATMTPDSFAPGNAPLIQHAARLGPIAAYDIRQQCGGFLYGLDLADAMQRAGRSRCAVVVGAEAHAGYLPFGPSQWGVLRGTHPGPVDPLEHATATEHRAWAVLFGDGAGAMVLRPGGDHEGFLASQLGTDGALFELIHVPGIGFTHQPYVDAAQLEAGLHHPHMNGMELFRQAVRLMPDAVERAAALAGQSPADLELVLVHQANERIVAGVAKQLGLPADRVPVNIAKYGNTTAATLPLLWHDLASAGRLPGPGGLLGFTAFGAGAHWGALIYRCPT
jgi:3-oxoacyl-[acyl-carrier-protein] synthase-3